MQVKGLNHRLNVMDAAEETYKQQLTSERDRAAQYEVESTEYRRNVARLQMDNEKLDQDVSLLRSDCVQLAQQLKEAEDRVRRHLECNKNHMKLSCRTIVLPALRNEVVKL